MKDALYEIEASNDIIEIVISHEKEFFRLSSFGIIGDTHVIKKIIYKFTSIWILKSIFLLD